MYICFDKRKDDTVIWESDDTSVVVVVVTIFEELLSTNCEFVEIFVDEEICLWMGSVGLEIEEERNVDSFEIWKLKYFDKIKEVQR